MLDWTEGENEVSRVLLELSNIAGEIHSRDSHHMTGLLVKLRIIVLIQTRLRICLKNMMPKHRVYSFTRLSALSGPSQTHLSTRFLSSTGTNSSTSERGPSMPSKSSSVDDCLHRLQMLSTLNPSKSQEPENQTNHP